MKIDRNIDSQLVEAYKAGDQLALNALVKRWHIRFCEKSYWIVKNAELSKDIAQETWQVIINKIDDLKDHGSFGSWALRIVCSKSFDALRSKNRERNRTHDIKQMQSLTETVNDENTDLKKALLLAITNLSEHQQVVIRLFYTEAYSLKEISNILNISVGTAKSRLFYAREKLKLILK